MADSSFVLAMVLKPILVAGGMGMMYGFMRLLWRFVPNGRIKQILFFHLWGKDNDPWNRPGAWDNAGPMSRGSRRRTEPLEQVFPRQSGSPEVDPQTQRRLPVQRP